MMRRKRAGENVWRSGTAAAVACFLLINFISERNHMLAKYMTAGLAASALLASVAFAQTSNGNDRPRQHGAGGRSNPSYQGDWRASKVVGLRVYNNNNESIGSINDLTDKSGNIKGVVSASAASSASASISSPCLRQDQIRQ